MLNFVVNQQLCTACGQCVADCPAMIIAMKNGYPDIAPDKETTCYKCQHCLAICPVGAVSILGLKPTGSRPLAGGFPKPDALETLLKGRRSIRRYRDENLEPALLQRLLEVAWHAPTGMNTRQVRFTVVDDKEKMASLREEVMSGLTGLVRDNGLTGSMQFYADFIKMWDNNRFDVIFRGAPHLLIASAPKSVASPLPDCLIALSYFELFAQANGVGTVWNGLAKVAINDLLPETRARLGIPADHIIGYVMSFGKPAVCFARTAQHGPAIIHRAP
ncbi:MAG: nitroreductase family protein [Desulfuromonadaceae bacterium]|nr:nitroreductase family protein [Desulfuromonadaceae bacterium]